MKMKQTPRRLVVLNINDRWDQISFGNEQNFVTIKEIHSYKAAQELLLDPEHGSNGRSGDLFLVDVDFSESDIPKGLNWGCSGLAPFGPLLALPFLGREVCALVPYSSYWGASEIEENGFVLVTMSLLLTSSMQDYYSLDDVREHIRSIKKAGLADSPKIALYNAFRIFRKNLENSDRIQLINIDRTFRRLMDLEQASFDQDIEISVPFTDREGVLSVDFSYPPYFFDSIELSSLFADVMDFWPPAEQGALTEIYDVLERWKKQSIETDGDTLAETAKAALEECEQFPLSKAIDRVLSPSSALSKFAVMRIAMEFAWVQAWYQELTSYEDEDSERPSLIKRVHTILGLSGLKNPAIEYRRLLSKKGSGPETVSEEPWRTKFKIEYSSTNDAYQLDADEPSAISPLERAMCIQYAQDELNWDGSSPQYPRWMIE